MRDLELWQRLMAYSFDGPGSAPFSVKLARSERWSPRFTERVIEEYRRFLYLTQVSTRQITPSRIVDAAWHMHLTYTRDYWDDLCPNVIRARVHHQPCAGEEEMPRYRDQFAATKILYEAEFGMEPPVDIWGRTQTKAKHETSTRRMVVSEAGMVSPTVIAAWPFAICLVLLILDPSLVSLALTVVTGIMFFVVLFNPRRRRNRGRNGRDSNSDSGGEFEWDDDDGDTHASSGRGGGSKGDGSSSVASKRSQDASTNRDKGQEDAGRGGFWAFFTGGDNDGDSDGGCGGCGGGD